MVVKIKLKGQRSMRLKTKNLKAKEIKDKNP